MYSQSENHLKIIPFINSEKLSLELHLLFKHHQITHEQTNTFLCTKCAKSPSVSGPKRIGVSRAKPGSRIKPGTVYTVPTTHAT